MINSRHTLTEIQSQPLPSASCQKKKQKPHLVPESVVLQRVHCSSSNNKSKKKNAFTESQKVMEYPRLSKSPQSWSARRF